ncbi:MAG: hypothetical protein IJA62_05420 [Ruminococcus sp.]|nr:hypothetical protein [Ruminococcus sp.]
MSKKNKNKKSIQTPPAQTSDRTIDSIIEETRFLSEQEKMEKEAAKLSGGPKMEEIYSNKSKEVRLTSQSPLDVVSDEDEPLQEEVPEAPAPDPKGSEKEEEEAEQIDVKLSPEYDEDTTISEDVIENVDSFNVRSIHMKDVDGIDIDLDEAEPEADADSSDASSSEESKKADEGLSSFERLFGKPKPVGAVQTVVSKVPVYQHESKVDKVHVRAGKFSSVVETEYKKYIASPNPVISQNLKPEPDNASEEESEKTTPKKIASGVAGKVVGFFSSHEDDDNEDFKEKTIQIEDYRSQQDAKSIMQEVNSNIRKMFVNSIFTGGIFILSLILTIVGRAITHSFTSALVLSLLNLILLFAAGWICRVTIINGISPLKKFKGNSDTGTAVAAIATALQCITAMFIPTSFFGGNKYLYTSIAVLALALNCLGKLFMVLRVKDNFKFVSSKNTSAYCAKIYTNEDVAQQFMSGTTHGGKPIIAYQHRTDFMSDFLRLSYSPDPSEDMASKLSPVTILCSLFVAVMYAVFSKDIWGAFSALAVMACVSAPICDLLAVNLPMRILCKDTLSKNAMISGYPAVRQFCDTRAVICRAQDLYPIDSITLNGVKAFSNHKLEEGMLAAAAVLKEANNPMACVFDHVVESNKDKLPKVESILYEDRLGLVGWVNGDRILFGNRSLLDKYAITPPSEEFEEKQKKEGRIVNYLVRSNELLAMFVATYDTTLRIAEQLQKAEASGISLLVHTTDCNVTGEKIAADFGIFYRSIKVLPTGLGNVCQEITSAKEDSSRAYLATRGSFLSFLRAVSGCVRLRNNVSIAVVLQLIGIIVGMLLVSTIALFAGVAALKNIELLIFVAFWAVACIAAPAFQKP